MTNNRAQLIIKRLDLLAGYSDRTDCLCREFGSDATREANLVVANWMVEAGLNARIDNVGNVRGCLNNGRSQLFLMGSHLDTVIDAGKFDGPLGVLLAIDQAQRLSHQDFPYDLEIIGFSNEEGLRFHHCYLGSHWISGSFDKDWLVSTDRSGISLNEAIQHMGGDFGAMATDIMENNRVAGYLEVHIEQGPVLEEIDCPVGVVSYIVGQRRYVVSVNGVAGHAGTVPMNNRKDALAGAAEVILEVERMAKSHSQMVATVGTLEVDQAATNVIPGNVAFTVDIRHKDLNLLDQVVRELMRFADQVASQRSLIISWEKVFEEKPVSCNQALIDQLGAAIESYGLPVNALPSGAGHDASVIAGIAPVVMLFVRCKHGISHSPLEYASIEDIEAAINVCDHFFDNLKI